MLLHVPHPLILDASNYINCSLKWILKLYGLSVKFVAEKASKVYTKLSY